MTPEGKVKKEITQELTRLKELGVKIWWFMPLGGRFGMAGIPDYIGLREGMFFAIEAKAETGKTSKLQVFIMNAILAAGGRARVVQPAQFLPIAHQVQQVLGILDESDIGYTEQGETK